MTYLELHAHCLTMQQALIDRIAAVLEAQEAQEHLQSVLGTAMAAVKEEVPPLEWDD